MPDISDLSEKSGKMKSSGSGRRSKANDANLSLNAEVEASLMERASRASPANRPLPFISDAMSEPRVKNRSGHKGNGKSLEDSSSAASTPPTKKHTPATMPRTKFTSATPLEQRIAISKLKQRLEFADRDEDSGMKQDAMGRNPLNNEGAAAASAVLYDQASISSMTESIAASQLESEASDMVDMSRILQRLNQVRDYLKQSTSLYVNLSTKDHLEKSEVDHVDKLGKLIQQLRIQEQGYVDLLQRTLVDMDQSANMTPASSVLSLKQSEADEAEDSQQELDKLQMQHSLLQKIVEQQQQIQDLKKKQATLAALQEQAEETMRATQPDDFADWPNNLRGDTLFNMLASLQENNPTAQRAVQETEPPTEEPIDNEAAALMDADMAQKKLELESKLMNLQEKKEKMDVLLRTLKASRDALSSDVVGRLPQQSQQAGQPSADNALSMGDAFLERSSQASANQGDVHEKLRKLKEVKQRLEDLGNIVSEYEQSRSNQLMTAGSGNAVATQHDRESSHASNDILSTGHRGARARNQQTGDFSDGLDNRMRPPPGGRFTRQAIDVTRNQSSAKDATLPLNIDAILASDKNITAASSNEDISSKIRQLQEARQRLASVQRTFQSGSEQNAANVQEADSNDVTTNSECESESDSISTAEDLSWQDDPEFQAKVRRLRLAKEKLKHLQDLVSSAQLDGISMDELLNISLSSKASNESDREDKEEDEDDSSLEEEDEVTTDQDSQANNDNDNDDDASIDQASRTEEKAEESDASNMNQAVTLLGREMEYQLRLSQQKKELEKLLKEKQKLLEAQRQLSEIARGTFVSKGEEESKDNDKKQQKSPRDQQNLKKEPESRAQTKSGNQSLKFREPTKTERSGNRVTYKDLQVPRIVKRTSNISVEPQFGSDSDFRTKRPRAPAQTNKQAGGRPSNPMVMSELRRQREMFEQNKKLKFVEKQRRKRDSGDDISDGGTYSIRSDIDEGVGVSMFSADVTTAATWGGSTEQSSTEEDSAVDEDDYAEGEVEIEDEYAENIGQPEEEEEEIADEVSEEDDVPPLFDFKKNSKKQKRDKPEPWFSVNDRRDPQRGKKRKLESRPTNASRGSTVSWSMNVSPQASRSQKRQQNLTPAHKLMRNRSSRPQEEYRSPPREDQSDQLRQQLSNSNTFVTTLLRSQQTLLAMLQSQSNNLNQQTNFNQTKHFGFQGGYEMPQSVFAESRETQFAQLQESQRSHEILQALNRCTSQLDRQCRDIQRLQREFQSMAINPPASPQKSYPWENPSPLNINTGYSPDRINELFRQSPNTKQDLFANASSYQNNLNPSDVQHRAGLINSATSPHECLDDTENRYTQTDLPSKAVSNTYSLFGQQQEQAANRSDSKLTDFSPFRFYDLNEAAKEGDQFFPTASASYGVVSQGAARNTGQDNTDKYDPLVYTDTSAGPVLADNRGSGVSSDVITASYPTPSKSAATRNMAERQRATWPSFLKDTDQLDTASERTASQYESNFTGRAVNSEAVNERRRQEKDAAREDMERMSVASNFSLFETMRDSIYSEVATLISMNESRPHYLVELFRELQLLTSDYLRQRALYSLQDLVTRFLTEDSEMRQSNEPTEEVYQNWIGTAAAEQTPTESAVTTDDEDQENKALEALSSQIRNNDIYDYAEIAETGSTRSTPTSNQDPPFAAEGLGDTVINLDEALQNMRLYEEKMAEARRNASGQNGQDHPALLTLAAAAAVSENSSAYDVNSETSSDIQQPSIDTQKLDRQIKAIMLELIPFLNENMESQCTQSFLSELRNLILKLAREKEPEAEKQEFGRSFHRQLESVLKDSLSKFEGRSLKECGEDILIDISEILFNELAFFRLMQDLDRPLSRQPGIYWRKDSSDADGQLAAIEIESEEVTQSTPNQTSQSRSSSAAYENEAIGQSVGYLVNTTGTLFSPPAPRQSEPAAKRNMFEEQLTIEDIETNGSDAEDETEAARQFVNVELSVSESRPVTSTGSGEEDVEEDQQNFPEQNRAPESSVGAQQQADVAAGSDAEANNVADDIDEMPEDEEHRISPRAQALQQERSSSTEPAEDEREEDGRDEGTREERESVEVDAAGAARPDSDVNNENGEENELTIDDLPTKLTGLTEADLQTRMESEQNAVEGAVGVLAHLEENEAEELAEDPNAVPQPDQQANNVSHE